MTIYVLTSGTYDDYHIICHIEGEASTEHIPTLFLLRENHILFLQENKIEYRFASYGLEYKVRIEYQGELIEHWMLFNPEFGYNIPSYLEWFLKKYGFTIVKNIGEIHL